MEEREIFAKVIKGYRHPWYGRTTELAKLYRQLVTGDGLDELLRQFVSRENESAFNQRKALTHHVVTTVVRNIMDVFYKVPRSNYQRILSHSGTGGEAKTGQLEDKLQNFWGVKSLDSYVQTRWLELNASDPNAFVVIEFGAFDHNNERLSPYPFEVNSSQAVDYVYDNNVLKHLVVNTKFALPTVKDQKRIGDKYTAYFSNYTATMMEIDETTISSVFGIIGDGKYAETAYGTIYKQGNRAYVLSVATPHNAGAVPAMQVGYSRDPWSNGKTFVSPFDSAVPLLKKSIKVNSELDITMSQQVFPHRAQYMPKCTAVDCLGGKTQNGADCTVCKGTGHASITSAQEIIYINLPKEGVDLWDLDKLLVFKGPPIEIVQFQADYVDKLTAGCKAVVFNSESFTREQIASTATGKNLDRDNVQDTLFTCAMGFADTWKYYVDMCAVLTSLDDGLESKLVFSKDFKLKGLTELTADLESAKRSEAGPAVVQHIQDNISRLIYAEDPTRYNKWVIQEKFNPFSGYGNDMVSLALTDPNVPKRYQVRYMMLGVMFQEIEAKFPNFYDMPYTEQSKIVEEMVTMYINESVAATAPPAIGTPAA